MAPPPRTCQITNTHILIPSQPILIIARIFCPFHHTGALLLHTSIIGSCSWKEVAVLCSPPNALCYAVINVMMTWNHLPACLEEICSLWVFFFCLVNWKEFVSFKSRSNGGIYYKHSDEVEGLDWKVHFSVLWQNVVLKWIISTCTHTHSHALACTQHLMNVCKCS